MMDPGRDPRQQPQPIRVLLVVDNLGIGGVREVVLSHLRSLDRDRFEPGLLTLEDDLHLVEREIPPETTFLAAKYRGEYSYRAIDYFSDGILLRPARRFGRSVLERIREFAPQILHFQTHPRNLGLGILASREKPMVLVFTDHSVRLRRSDYSPQGRALLRLSYRRLYRHYNVISVGRAVASANRVAGFLSPSKHHLLLETEIDVDRFHPPTVPRSTDPLEIIQVGRIHPVKGHDTMIRAFARLKPSKSIRLTLVGPDAMGGAMHRFAAECVREPLEVRFLGPRADVPALLRRASIGALPSRREGVPVALVEMMASGLPVVVSDIPETVGIVSDGIDGLVVPVDDVDALSAALGRLVADAQLRERVGRAARISVERRTRGDLIPRLERFYEALVAGSKHRSGTRRRRHPPRRLRDARRRGARVRQSAP